MDRNREKIERNLIAAMLQDKEALLAGLSLTKYHFKNLWCRKTWEAIKRHHEIEGDDVNIVTISAEGIDFEQLADVVDENISAANAKASVKILQDLYLAEQVKMAGIKIQQLSELKGADALFKAHQIIDEIDQVQQIETFVPARNYLPDIEKIIWDAYEEPNKLEGISTGFGKLDIILGGLSGGDYIILAGRPGHGKTAFALQIAHNIASRGLCVGLLSLEMSAISLMRRLANLRVGEQITRLQETSPPEATKKISKIQGWELYIDDHGGTLNEIIGRIKLGKIKYKFDIVILDYLGLIKANRSYDSRYREITEISMTLKNLAKELNIPILALNQLSRRIEEGRSKKFEDRIPKLSDLRESGALEQDGDKILFIVRPELYGISSITADGQVLDSDGLAVLKVGKNRNGVANKLLYMKFNPQINKFNFIELEQKERTPIF